MDGRVQMTTYSETFGALAFAAETHQFISAELTAHLRIRVSSSMAREALKPEEHRHDAATACYSSLCYVPWKMAWQVDTKH